MENIDYVIAEIAQRAWEESRFVKSYEFGITDEQTRWVYTMKKVREYLEREPAKNATN